ncbi:methionine--tRNA ligase [Oenococcus oeni]|uniref:methionine--tRNA ligase n=1 Tax=Oenococcus oeni TaxID=1247 RepID=UPI000277B542|nr:methionine--tRNA ligase [Oenococcus oeni]EJO05453.1 methionyl-tRNA synthetase [Oenococcus oeni AWRIB548]EJO07429.1 methionyl-tRNA synthetase [Oenococcus oeni AWRIB422]KEP85301.1 methionyl-tRNA synthetase [Oenococcus oeni IOEB_0205]KGH67348.1 methionine--tRNA ligase [Oenococcus oeni IOEB_B16]OIL79379.1 methionine--tRNA ligase [Oenococcus oeni]
MTKKNRFYITTPIYYPSGKLQLGNTYTTVLADSVARFHRALGEDVFFLTGTDEHGLKIQEKAEAAGKSEMEYLDEMAVSIKKLWKLMNISYDKFIRTTDAYHERVVQHIFKKFMDEGDIYKGNYTGWYSVSDEEYFTESQLAEVYRDKGGKVIGGKAPSGHEVQLVKEETYFFKMSKYSDWLLQYYHDHPEFLQPESRINEMISNFIKPGLEDLALTRTSFNWGIPVPGDEKHVIYVWIDALSNYITALGYDPELGDFDHQPELFKKFWPANLQLVGKEIVRFHTIYWPIMLHALGLPLPGEVLGHGWLVMKNGKMSKSKGNVVYPETLESRYGLDAVRYYLLRSMPFGNDGVFSPEDFVNRVNFDLANDLGNLLNRTISMINRYDNGLIPKLGKLLPEDRELEETASQAVENFKDEMEKVHTADALEAVWTLIRRTNKYIDETEPWVLDKNKQRAELDDAMAHLAASLRVVGSLLQPVLTQAPKKIFDQLGLPEVEPISNLNFADIPTGVKVVERPTPLFPRLDVKKEVEFISGLVQKDTKGKGRARMEAAKEKAREELQNETVEEINYDDFAKLRLIAGKIKSGEILKNSKKLIKWQIDDGSEGGRQILSGIREWYPDPSVLVGKKIAIVANLKAKKMAGEISQGMILCAENSDGKVIVSELPDEVEAGAVIN